MKACCQHLLKAILHCSERGKSHPRICRKGQKSQQQQKAENNISKVRIMSSTHFSAKPGLKKIRFRKKNWTDCHRKNFFGWNKTFLSARKLCFCRSNVQTHAGLLIYDRLKEHKSKKKNIFRLRWRQKGKKIYGLSSRLLDSRYMVRLTSACEFKFLAVGR